MCTLLSTALSRLTSKEQQKWLQAVQKRLGATQKMLASLKAIKMMGMERRVHRLVSNLRLDEMTAAKTFRKLLSLTAVLCKSISNPAPRHDRVYSDTLPGIPTAYATLTHSPLLVFGAYLAAIGIDSSAGDVDAPRMFTCLVLIALLASPLIHLFQALPTLGAAHGCFQRLHDFFSLNERLPLVIDRELAVSSPDVVVSAEQASFGYEGGKSLLHDVNLSLKKGKHVVILGAVGTGKSLLLKSILGEACIVQGRVSRSTVSIAYCAQTPWLENTSAESNWTQHAAGDSGWMEQVAWACFMDDVVKLEDYRSGKVGSGGTRLSGGQRQRLVSESEGLVTRAWHCYLTHLFSPPRPLRELWL